MRRELEFVKEISSKNGVGYSGDHGNPPEFSAKAKVPAQEDDDRML